MSNASEDFAGIGVGHVVHTPPSGKQQNAAKIISSVLGIPLPAEFSMDAYWVFIFENIEESKQRAYAQRIQCRKSLQNARVAAAKSNVQLIAQHEADWEALNLDARVWAQRVLDGEELPPSWSGRTIEDMRRQLRSLGYQSSLEEQYTRLQDEMERECHE